MKKSVCVRWVTGLAMALATWACSQSKPDAGDPGGTNSTGPVDACATPNEGCPCDEPGKVVDCGHIELRSGDYVSCTMGRRTCMGATWGACIGDQVTTKRFAGGGDGLHFNDLAVGATACTDPCDPYCQNYVDTTDAMTAPPGFTIDGGLAVSGTGPTGTVPASVQTTSNGDSTCGAALNLHSNPCNGSPLTACQQDYRCDTATNSCIWNGGEGYYDPTAAGPDLTIGSACDIGWGNIVPVCNRGSVAVAAGAKVNVYLQSTATPPNGCTTNTATPECSMAVPTGGLAPGSCLNVVCTIPGDKYAVVNPPGSPGGVTEAAGRCANNGAYASTTGNAGCATCQSCNTTITGRVMDPGMTVGLNGITVFQPNRALAAIPDNVGGATRPPCDTCDSLLDPTSFSTGVNSEIDGAFTLTRVAPGPNQKIVAQTGRWRRVTTLDIPACQTTTLADDAIRMPKNRREGDIPKMALVEASREALECWLLKVGMDPNEIWPRGGTAPGDTQPNQARIQLYQNNGMGQRSACGGQPGEQCTSGSSCISGSTCNVGVNTCSSTCGGNAQACCESGTPCSGTRVCDPATNTCKTGGGSNQPCLAGRTCSATTRACDGTNKCVTCGASGQPCCSSGTACNSGLGCEAATNTCRTGGADGQPCRASGTACTGTGTSCVNTTANGVAGKVCADSAPCGGAGQACCASNTCQTPLTCGGGGTAGKCGKCGGAGEVCCAGDTCTTGTCGGGGVAGRCGSGCGGNGDPCCGGNSCNAGLTCGGGGTAGMCGTNSCGGSGQACCAGNTCLSPLACNGGTCNLGAGACATRPTPPYGPQLWGSNEINEFSAVILPCDGHENTYFSGSTFAPTATEAANMLAYANAGGRIFMDHLTASSSWLNSTNAPTAWKASNVTTWGSNSTPTNPAAGFVWGIGGTGTAAQQSFNSWISTWAPWPGPTPPAGGAWLRVDAPRTDALVVGANAQEFVRGRANNSWPSPPYSQATGTTVCKSGTGCSSTGYTYSLTFSFETGPTGTPAAQSSANTCGRVIYNGMHTSESRTANYPPSTSDEFPVACNLSFGLTPEEKALEYQFFQLTACALGGAPPPPPPPPPPTLAEQSVFTRDYQAICTAGYRPRWNYFSWQASIPTGTKIGFKAQTAGTQAALGTAPQVGAGTATTTTATWTSDPNTVEWHLNNDIPGNRLTSDSWLRIEMTFNTNGYVSPVLQNWRQTFDCVPAE